MGNWGALQPTLAPHLLENELAGAGDLEVLEVHFVKIVAAVDRDLVDVERLDLGDREVLPKVAVRQVLAQQLDRLTDTLVDVFRGPGALSDNIRCKDEITRFSHA
jgi:hypothetical protein